MSKKSLLEEEYAVNFFEKLTLEEKNYILQFVMLKDRILHHQMQSKHQWPIHQVGDLDPSMLEETLLCPILELIHTIQEQNKFRRNKKKTLKSSQLMLC